MSIRVWMISLALVALACAPAWAQSASAPVSAAPAAPAPAAASSAPLASSGPSLAVAGTGVQPVLQPGLEDAGFKASAHGAPALVIDEGARKLIQPYVVIAGGLRFESLQRRAGQTTQARQGVTVAVSRFGMRGRVGRYVTFASELEANFGGAVGNGASVWEGQAQLSVRDQYLQYQRNGFRVAVGRVTDLTTIDFVSAHVADLLLVDKYTRDPLLFSGANRGNGILARYNPVPGLELGVALHSTNPTGITGTLVIGGELFPYDRPFYLAAAQVGRSEFSLPDQNLHIYMVTPSVTYSTPMVEIKLANQFYSLDTRVSTDDDELIFGYNIRGSIKLNLDMGGGARITPFINGSRNENEALDPMDATIKLVDTFSAYTLSGGVDYLTPEGHGVGAQYAIIQQQAPGIAEIVDSYLNVGGTYFIEDGVSVGARVGWYQRDEGGDIDPYGDVSLMLTGRLIY